MHMKNKNNWEKMLVCLAAILITAAFFSLASCDEDEKKPSVTSDGELLPVFLDIDFSGEFQEGDEITEDMIPPGGLVAAEDDGILDPNAQFVVSKSARAIRRIVKQDVYGRQKR